jgi:hypothetical protein
MKPLLHWSMPILLVLLSACTPQTIASPEPTPLTTPSQASEVPAASLPADLASWTDRSVFSTGLVSSQHSQLAGLPGASVYHISISLNESYTFLSGHEEVMYTNRESVPLIEIYFQLFPNMEGGTTSISNLVVDNQPVDPIYESGKSSLKVALPSPLQMGKSTLIRLDFAVTVPTETAGNYGLFAYKDGLLALDGFIPSIPVYDEAGWHDGLVPPNADTTFQDTSFYIVQVTAPTALTLVASGVQVAETTNGDQQTVVFAAGPARDFYLAGSEDYTVLSQSDGQTVVNVYTRADQMEGAKVALQSAVAALNSYSERFAPYPYTEFDVVCTPMDGAYGIEYPGITGINQTLFNSNTSVNGTSAFTLLESTTAHETGHQWFYNLVGNDQANEPWLDEAVTQYVTGLAFLDRYGSAGWQGYVDSWKARWARVENADLPIGLPAGDYQGREYSSIVYGRGPLFLQALAQKMGQSTFDAFLSDYVRQNEWGITNSVQFRSLAEAHCNCDLSDLFSQWVLPE